MLLTRFGCCQILEVRATILLEACRFPPSIHLPNRNPGIPSSESRDIDSLARLSYFPDHVNLGNRKSWILEITKTIGPSSINPSSSDIQTRIHGYLDLRAQPHGNLGIESRGKLWQTHRGLPGSEPAHLQDDPLD